MKLLYSVRLRIKNPGMHQKLRSRKADAETLLKLVLLELRTSSGNEAFASNLRRRPRLATSAASSVSTARQNARTALDSMLDSEKDKLQLKKKNRTFKFRGHSLRLGFVRLNLRLHSNQ